MVGLLPWLVTGGRLLLQNLWATDVMPDQMPLVLLPFSQYTIGTLLGVLAGPYAVGACWRARWGRNARGAGQLLLGIVAVQLVAVTQTATVVGAGLQRSKLATMYMGAMSAVIACGMVFGIVAYLLLARARRAGVVLGGAMVSLAAAWWFAAAFSVMSSHQQWLNAVPVQWIVMIVSGVGVGTAVGWGGLWRRSVIATSVLAFVLLWFVPSFIAAASFVAGSRALWAQPSGVPSDFVWAVRQFMVAPEYLLWPLATAAVVASVWLVAGSRRAAITGDARLSGWRG